MVSKYLPILDSYVCKSFLIKDIGIRTVINYQKVAFRVPMRLTCVNSSCNFWGFKQNCSMQRAPYFSVSS
jgi:hypothetical protein